MSPALRLWVASSTLGIAGGIAFQQAAHWPGVVLFLAGAAVAIVAATLESNARASESTLAQRLDSTEARVNAINLEALAQLQKDVEYLKTKEALNTGVGL